MTERTYPVVVPTFRYFLDLVPCRTGCPVRTNAGAYVRAIARPTKVWVELNIED